MLAKPEEVGLSAQPLERIGTHVQRYIDAGKVAGTLTLVARHGQIAYFEPQGYLELERTRPVQHDSIFRIYSMSKPITSVGSSSNFDLQRVRGCQLTPTRLRCLSPQHQGEQHDKPFRLRCPQGYLAPTDRSIA